jgi:hypothetical protein
MKSFVRISALVGVLAAVAGGHTASAQIATSIEFTTSFPFTVGNATMPAGSYTVTPVDEGQQVLELTGEKTSVLFLIENVQPKETPSKDEIVFTRYGDHYVLKNIFTAGSDIGYVSEAALGERHVSKHVGATTESRIAARKATMAAK